MILKRQIIYIYTKKSQNVRKNVVPTDYEYRIVSLQNKIFSLECQLNVVNSKLSESEQELLVIKVIISIYIYMYKFDKITENI